MIETIVDRVCDGILVASGVTNCHHGASEQKLIALLLIALRGI